MTLTEVARRQSVWIDGEGGIRPLEEPRTSRQTLQGVQAQKKAHRWKYITLNVGGDVARFACEYLHQM